MNTSHQNLSINLEFTPNPNTLKYAISQNLIPSGAYQFTSLDKAKGVSPLAEKILSLTGIEAVMIGVDFVTITKSDAGDWDQVHQSALKTLEDHLKDGLPVLTVDAQTQTTSGHGAGKGGVHTELESKIKEILDNEVRPAVAMDGGDITFDRFEEGVVYLQLKGSCSGCPSSTATLKMGIETRLREKIPEVKEVVSV